MRIPEKNLQKIIDGPVYLLEGKDGMVYGNSQALAKEVQTLRTALESIVFEIENDPTLIAGIDARIVNFAKRALDSDKVDGNG